MLKKVDASLKRDLSCGHTEAVAEAFRARVFW